MGVTVSVGIFVPASVEVGEFRASVEVGEVGR